MSRPRHKDKDIEAIFRRFERIGWKVDGGGGKHFQMRCPQPCSKHMIVASGTPGSGNLKRTLMTQLKNHTCWKGEV